MSESGAFVKVSGFEEKNPLDEDQVKLAKLQIDDLHPISDTFLDVAFPWACCCLRKYRKAENSEAASMQKQSSQIMESMGKGLTQATTKDQKREMLMMMKKKMKAE